MTSGQHVDVFNPGNQQKLENNSMLSDMGMNAESNGKQLVQVL